MVQRRQEGCQLSGGAVPVDGVDDLEQGRPATRRVTSITGSRLLATISGRNGTSVPLDNAVKTPISWATRRAA
jgi:hypothetical protein